MTTFKNPFEPGDILWYEIQGVPYIFYIVYSNNTARQIGKVAVESLEGILRHHKDKDTGPFKLIYAENWSAYDFGID